jgi:hypothetical protein
MYAFVLRPSKPLVETRDFAKKGGLIRRKADLDIPREPSVCGIDGSYQIHRLTSLDLCAAAAVAVEGTSKEARRHWPEPYHQMWAAGIPHDINTTNALRGLMVSMELSLAREAPHDLVLLDGAFGSLIIYLNQGLSNLAVPTLGEELRRRWHDQKIFQALLRLLTSERTVAVPKFTSQNELVTYGHIQVPVQVDGRTLASLVLEPGEYTVPLPVYEEPYHLPSSSGIDEGEMNGALGAIRAIYYRPFGWVPALRIELPGALANSATRLSIALEGIYRQFFSPAVIEPYPLFMADRMVKSLGSGISVIEQAVAQHASSRTWTSVSSKLAVDATSVTPAQGTSIALATPTGESNQIWVIR